MAEEITQFKKSMRKIMVKKRREMDPFERDRVSDQIVRRFLESKSYNEAKTIMAYESMPEEVQMQSFFDQAFKDGKRLAIPFIVSTGVMRPVLLPSMDVLVEGDFGIKTVREEDRIFLQPDALDVILVPGAAFDYSGHRLGLGQGYYDHFLTRAHRAKKIGIGFDFQLSYQVPFEPHDINVDAIITSTRVVSVYDWGIQVWTKQGTPPWL